MGKRLNGIARRGRVSRSGLRVEPAECSVASRWKFLAIAANPCLAPRAHGALPFPSSSVGYARQ